VPIVGRLARLDLKAAQHSAAGMRRPKQFDDIVKSMGSAAANAARHDRAVRPHNAFRDYAATRPNESGTRCNDHRTNAGTANATAGDNNAAAWTNDAIPHNPASHLINMIWHRDNGRGHPRLSGRCGKERGHDRGGGSDRGKSEAHFKFSMCHVALPTMSSA